MSLNSKYERRKVLFALLLFFAHSTAFGQQAKFKLNPYVNGITSINEGILEFGPEIKRDNLTSRLFIKLPLTDKKNSLTQIDGQTTSWRIANAWEYEIDKTSEKGPFKHYHFALQYEIGSKEYTYFPNGVEANKQNANHTSFSIEGKAGKYLTKGDILSRQFALQFKVRYSRDWEDSKQVGVVLPPDFSGLSVVVNRVISHPSTNPTLSPAFSLGYYPGTRDFSFAPTIYYYWQGDQNGHKPFGKLERVRLEGWIFYYPSIANTPNVRIGIAPFWTCRTRGSDSLEKTDLGGILQLKIGASFLRFF